MEIPMGTEKGIRENMMVVVVVEYLGDSMSKDLLCKFPDNSAFDFDYSQSSLWSPLRNLPYCSNNDDDEEVDEEEEEESEHEGLMLVDAFKKATVDLRKKIATGTGFFHSKIRMLKQRKKMLKLKKKKSAFDLSPIPVSSPTPRKGWNKLLKVASKRFKKATKKKDPMHLSYQA